MAHSNAVVKSPVGIDSNQNEELDWQQNKSVAESNRFRLVHQINCDVQFAFPNKGRDNPTVVGAHKYVLATRSPAFFAMFEGPAREESDTINIEDDIVDDASFMEMLKFCYTDHVELTGDNVMPIFYLAKKYMLQRLVKICQNFIEENLDAGNVCPVLENSISLDETKLIEICYSIIDYDTKQVINSESFMDISETTLSQIICRDTLIGATEFEIFQAVINWATNECRKQEYPINMENMRKVLGSVLYLVRFPLMTLEQLADHVTRSDMLTNDETLPIFLHITRTKKDVAALQFPTEKRSSKFHNIYFVPVTEDILDPMEPAVSQPHSQNTFAFSLIASLSSLDTLVINRKVCISHLYLIDRPTLKLTDIELLLQNGKLLGFPKEQLIYTNHRILGGHRVLSIPICSPLDVEEGESMQLKISYTTNQKGATLYQNSSYYNNLADNTHDSYTLKCKGIQFTVNGKDSFKKAHMYFLAGVRYQIKAYTTKEKPKDNGCPFDSIYWA